MKKFFVLSVLLLLGLTAMISSCKKDASGCKATRVYYGYDSAYYSDLTYDGDKLQHQYYKDKTGRLEQTYNYSYSSTGKLSGYEIVDTNGITHKRYEYLFNGDDQVIRENLYYPDGTTLYWHYIFEYNSDGTLKKSTFYVGPNLSSTTYYTGYDANGNNTKNYQDDALGITQDTILYTYDDHPNPHRIFGFRESLTINNVKTADYKPTAGSAIFYTYSYTYNSMGYPTYCNEQEAGIYNFVYDCSK